MFILRAGSSLLASASLRGSPDAATAVVSAAVLVYNVKWVLSKLFGDNATSVTPHVSQEGRT